LPQLDGYRRIVEVSLVETNEELMEAMYWCGERIELNLKLTERRQGLADYEDRIVRYNRIDLRVDRRGHPAYVGDVLNWAAQLAHGAILRRLLRGKWHLR
jgi:hypothetical protein